MSRYFAPLRLGLGRPALRSITSTAPTTRILPAALGSKNASPARKGIALVHLDDAFEKIAEVTQYVESVELVIFLIYLKLPLRSHISGLHDKVYVQYV